MNHTRNKQVEYLAALLERNPVDEADAILDARAAMLGLRTRAAGHGQSFAERRELRGQARQAIDDLRRDFWTMKLDELQAKLASLDVEAFAELRPAKERLETMAVQRPGFARLAAHPMMEPSLLKAFRQVAVMPPREAAEFKQRFMSRDELRGAQLLRVKRMARAMAEEFPELFALEKDWLGELLLIVPWRRWHGVIDDACDKIAELGLGAAMIVGVLVGAAVLWYGLRILSWLLF